MTLNYETTRLQENMESHATLGAEIVIVHLLTGVQMNCLLWPWCQDQLIQRSAPTLCVYFRRGVTAICNVFSWDCIVVQTVVDMIGEWDPSWNIAVTLQLHCVGEFVKTYVPCDFSARSLWWIHHKINSNGITVGRKFLQTFTTFLKQHVVEIILH